MALKASVAVEGMHAVENLLNDIGAAASDKVIRKALRAGSNSMLKETKAAAPVDSGLLKRSLIVRALRRKKGRIGFRIGFKNVEQIVERSTFGKNKFGPHDPNKKKKRHFYPAVVEYGAKNKPAKPFMRPVFQRNKEEALNIIKTELREGVIAAARNATK